MRLFIAIDISNEVKKYLSSIEITGRKPKDYHITLAFLGDKNPEDIVKKLQDVEFERFTLKLSKIGCFPNKFSPRVTWVDVEPKQLVYELHEKIETVLGIKDKKFSPHITLARNPKQFKDVKIEPMSFRVNSFLLMNSTLTPRGPIYEVLHKFA